jgi:hypothetical protein
MVRLSALRRIGLFTIVLSATFAVLCYWRYVNLSASFALTPQSKPSLPASPVVRNTEAPPPLTEKTTPLNENERSIPVQINDIEKLKSIARHSHLQFLDSGSLQLKPALVELANLTDEQAAALNGITQDFLAQLRSAEIEHAFVRVRPDGSEEIVVSPFSRDVLLQRLRDNISLRLGSRMADFSHTQIRYDSTLAVENAEMRLYIKDVKDGTPHVVFERKVRRREADERSTQKRGEPRALTAVTFIDENPVGPEFDLRYRHLFLAEKSLPRGTEKPK